MASLESVFASANAAQHLAIVDEQLSDSLGELMELAAADPASLRQDLEECAVPASDAQRIVAALAAAAKADVADAAIASARDAAARGRRQHGAREHRLAAAARGVAWALLLPCAQHAVHRGPRRGRAHRTRAARVRLRRPHSAAE